MGGGGDACMVLYTGVVRYTGAVHVCGANAPLVPLENIKYKIIYIYTGVDVYSHTEYK